jgi:hypothetical protein
MQKLNVIGKKDLGYDFVQSVKKNMDGEVGHFRENIEILKSAIEYIKKHNE